MTLHPSSLSLCPTHPSKVGTWTMWVQALLLDPSLGNHSLHIPIRGPVWWQDVIIHVRDLSHPEAELQKACVLSTLQNLHLPAPLLASIIEVHNKVDLVPG